MQFYKNIFMKLVRIKIAYFFQSRKRNIFTVKKCFGVILLKTTSENQNVLYVFLYIFQESYACEDNDGDDYFNCDDAGDLIDCIDDDVHIYPGGK